MMWFVTTNAALFDRDMAAVIWFVGKEQNGPYYYYGKHWPKRDVLYICLLVSKNYHKKSFWFSTTF